MSRTSYGIYNQRKNKIQNIEYQKTKEQNNNKQKFCKNQVINKQALCHETSGNSIVIKFSIASGTRNNINRLVT